MSDSFADLWASSAPTKPSPQQPQKTIGSSAPPRRQQYDTFSILSASQPSSRYVANNQPSDRQGRQPQPASREGDAFSDLFASSLDGTLANRNPDRANLTMAERTVLAQKATVAQNNAMSTRREPASSSPSLWDGLDALVRPTTASPRPTTSAQGNTSSRDTFDFGLDSAPAAGAVSSSTSPPDDDWSLSEFTLQPSKSQPGPGPTKSVSRTQPANLWDLDDFSSSEPRTSPPQTQVPPRSLTGTPGDFDFGDRERVLLGDDNSDMEDTFGIPGGQDKDDILGDLGKPVVRFVLVFNGLLLMYAYIL